CGVLGLARLRPAPDDERSARVFFRRALTEAMHEIGHMAGLGHCADPGCVMHFSHGVQETDRKGVEFCARCRRS
ncbi:MAG TPA: matrixin family metalloprotease, partial [Longimicrobiales bacterium]